MRPFSLLRGLFIFITVIVFIDCKDAMGPSAGFPPLDPLLQDGVELNVAYGAHERNVLDFWIADPDSLSPVTIYIHGGGFVGGSKENLNSTIRDELLEAGISVAAINYRYITTHPMPAPMHDAGRAIQFLRSKGEEWRIDPGKIAAFGGSAGACISMWLGMHDDLAEPESDDPLARESTRLQAIGPSGGQSSLDPEWILEHFPGGNTHMHPNLPMAFGVDTHAELSNPDIHILIEEMSAINHVDPGDPPTYMTYNQENDSLPPNADPRAGIHHPIFGIKLKEALDAVGVEAILVIRGEAVDTDPYESLVNFLVAKLSRLE